jgi:uncharacterized membrane protein YqaE (UPF0057 family)
MRYFLCIFLPPVAVLSCGKVGAFFLNLLLCITIIGAVIHAFMVVNKYYADKRHNELISTMRYNSNQQGPIASR